MALLEVLKYPDPRLRELSEVVNVFDSELQKFSQDMLETMYDSKGIGLAAPQVGRLIRLLVVDTRPRETGGRYEENQLTDLEAKVYEKFKGPLIMINPEIVKGVGKTKYNEGCLSVPSFYDEVERLQTIELKFQDVHGKVHHIQTDGLLGICVQHEMDHLEGTLFIDHLSFVKSNKIKNQIKKHGYPEKEKDAEDDVEESEVSMKPLEPQLEKKR